MSWVRFIILLATAADGSGKGCRCRIMARPGVTVRRFVSRRDSSNNLELRYFELQPGAHTNWEQHNYEHAVLVLRGHGRVRLGEEFFPIRFGDAVFVAADEIHEFVAAADDLLGLMCTVLDKELRVVVHSEQTLKVFG
jgi:quercetin dioxygenase-like cupin family protein